MTQSLRPNHPSRSPLSKSDPSSTLSHRDDQSCRAQPPLACKLSTQHLLTITDLNDDDIASIINRALYYINILRTKRTAPQILKARTQINLFFEDSTRTNLSFDLAGKKLGADVINVPVAASSVNKNEDMIDTVQTLNAMGADVMIVRASQPGIQQVLAHKVSCPVINAGDGTIEHPTQALLDAVTLTESFGSLSGLTIAICGDIRHSRVAGSGVRLFQRLGATVRFVGPQALMPTSDMYAGIERFNTLETGLAGADVVMALRMQFERMEDRSAVDQHEYYSTFGLTHTTLELAKPTAKVMHPGPMNRGIEISDALADDCDRSLILNQVFNGVATRMAVLDLMIAHAQIEDEMAAL